MKDKEDFSPASTPAGHGAAQTAFGVLAALAVCHLLNDLVQSLLPAIYPVLKQAYGLTFVQIGLITLSTQMTASILQPFVGHFADRKSMPYSLVVGMVFTLVGLLLLAFANTFGLLAIAAALVGIGSSVFHPEASRLARVASGGQHGLAQSLFQVGGNTGSSLGPLLAAFVIVRRGQHSLADFSAAALTAIVIMAWVGAWYKQHPSFQKKSGRKTPPVATANSPSRVGIPLAILLSLVFSKYFYLASITSYYTFYLIDKFNVSIQTAQIHLFVFLAAVALGTFIGGPIGDRFGRKFVILGSILGVVPFTLILPHVGLGATEMLSIVIGFVLASAFSAIIVYAQELLPGRVGMVSGLFFGFAFGMAGIAAALLGYLADLRGIVFVYNICAYLPIIGIFALFLPNLDGPGACRPRQSAPPAWPTPSTGRRRPPRPTSDTRDGEGDSTSAPGLLHE